MLVAVVTEFVAIATGATPLPQQEVPLLHALLRECC